MGVVAGKRYKSTPRTVTTVVPRQEVFGGTLMVRAQEAGASYDSQTHSVNTPALELHLLPGVADPIVPGSLVVQWGG